MGNAGYTGGCLCGRVRYRIEAPLDDIAHCHCRMCRKSAEGHITAAWATVPFPSVVWTSDEPVSFASSPHSRRLFCSACGVLVAMHTTLAQDTLDITVATLDESERHSATRHVWYANKFSWLHLDDDLPTESQETM